MPKNATRKSTRSTRKSTRSTRSNQQQQTNADPKESLPLVAETPLSEEKPTTPPPAPRKQQRAQHPRNENCAARKSLDMDAAAADADADADADTNTTADAAPEPTSDDDVAPKSADSSSDNDAPEHADGSTDEDAVAPEPSINADVEPSSTADATPETTRKRKRCDDSESEFELPSTDFAVLEYVEQLEKKFSDKDDLNMHVWKLHQDLARNLLPQDTLNAETLRQNNHWLFLMQLLKNLCHQKFGFTPKKPSETTSSSSSSHTNRRCGNCRHPGHTRDKCDQPIQNKRRRRSKTPPPDYVTRQSLEEIISYLFQCLSDNPEQAAAQFQMLYQNN